MGSNTLGDINAFSIKQNGDLDNSHIPDISTINQYDNE